LASNEQKLNISIQSLMASSRENTTTNDIYFIWDLLNPIVRFLLLNQTVNSSNGPNQVFFGSSATIPTVGCYISVIQLA
jgi:hypothetical protein